MKAISSSIIYLTVLCSALFISGCSSTKPGIATPPVKTTPGISGSGTAPTTGTSTQSFKLSKASVSWIDNPGIPVLTASGEKGTINSGDTARALTALRGNTPRDVAQALKAKQVEAGSNESITLMPVGSLLDANGTTTAVIIRIVVTQRTSGAQWRTDLELGDRKQPVAMKPSMSTTASSTAFSSLLVTMMSKTGLL